jgi:hypothetical protein
MEGISKLNPVLLDSFVLHLVHDRFSVPHHLVEVVDTLLQNGARDWSNAMRASASGQFNLLETLVKKESDSVSIRRMLNVQDMQSRSILSHVLSWEERSPHDFEHYFDIVHLLLKHGSLITVQDVMNANAIQYTDSALAVQMMLLAEQKGVASDALHLLCNNLNWITMNWKNYLLQVHILLTSGADSTLKNEDAKTTREQLEEKYLKYHSHDNGTDPKKFLLAMKMRRWEEYHRDSSIGNPSDQPDEDWIAVYDMVVMRAGEHRWSSLVTKNPGLQGS